MAAVKDSVGKTVTYSHYITLNDLLLPFITALIHFFYRYIKYRYIKYTKYIKDCYKKTTLSQLSKPPGCVGCSWMLCPLITKKFRCEIKTNRKKKPFGKHFTAKPYLIVYNYSVAWFQYVWRLLIAPQVMKPPKAMPRVKKRTSL